MFEELAPLYSSLFYHLHREFLYTGASVFVEQAMPGPNLERRVEILFDMTHGILNSPRAGDRLPHISLE